MRDEQGIDKSQVKVVKSHKKQKDDVADNQSEDWNVGDGSEARQNETSKSLQQVS